MTQTFGFASDGDRHQLEQHGIGMEEAARQWALLTEAPRRVTLDRPCTVGDGIHQIAAREHADLVHAHRHSAGDGRWLKFVPASGAASRMFAMRSNDDKQRFCESLEQFAFLDTVQRGLAAEGRELGQLLRARCYDELVAAVVSSAGLGYVELPKGLVEFHRYQDRTRTPFEEHLLEGLACLNNHDGGLAAHFTIAAEHRGGFDQALQRFQAELPRGNCQVTFSVQDPSTDTIALDGDGQLLRDASQQLVFRPGGHGALIENLNRVNGDLIFVKNIDNVGHESMREATLLWTQLLGGYLIRLERAVHQQLQTLRSDDPAAIAAASDFVRAMFPGVVLPIGPKGRDRDTQGPALFSLLSRPLRVCGMVRNEGEPGGGPFWVRQADGGTSLQIVESAELDPRDDHAQAVFGASTHFNPVFMALAVRDERGKTFDLRQFVEGGRAIITRKHSGGQTATVLERPGLWNGAMAKWNTIFVEVPKQVFSPVKTVFDLLRPEHQPRHEGSAGR